MTKAKHIKYILYILGVVVLSACIQLGSPAPQNFYLLEVDPDLAAVNNEITAIIAIELTDFPDHLKRAPIVAKERDHQIRFSDAHRWSQPLDSSLLKTIRRGMQRQLPEATIAIAPWENLRSPQYRIDINVTDFSGILGDKLEINIRWQISSKARVLQQGIFTDNRPVGTDYADLVTALNDGINNFSQEMVNILVKL